AAKGPHPGLIRLVLTDDEVGLAVAVEVAGGDENPARIIRVKGHEAVEDVRGVKRVEDFDLRSAGGARARNDVGLSVAVDIARGHANPARESHGISVEAADFGAGLAAKDAHVRTAGRAGAGDHIREAVAIDVAGGDENAAAEGGIVSHEAADRTAQL